MAELSNEVEESLRSRGKRKAWPAEKVELWSIDRLIPYAQNNLDHRPEDVKKIAASIAEFGWTMSCLVDEQGVLIAGHGRVLAAEVLGIDEVPVCIAVGWTEAQKKAYRIADNKLARISPWDVDNLKLEIQALSELDYQPTITGFEIPELEQLMLDVLEGETDPMSEWDGMPEFNHEEDCFRKIVVNFMCKAHVHEFFEAIGQPYHEKKYHWYPNVPDRPLNDAEFRDEQS